MVSGAPERGESSENTRLSLPCFTAVAWCPSWSCEMVITRAGIVEVEPAMQHFFETSRYPFDLLSLLLFGLRRRQPLENIPLVNI